MRNPNSASRHKRQQVIQCGQVINGPEYHKGLTGQLENFVSGNKLLPVPSLLETVNTRTISLLTTDIKTRKFLGFNREITEEVLKCLKIEVEVLAPLNAGHITQDRSRW